MAEQGRVRTVPTAIRIALIAGMAGTLLLIGLITTKAGPWQRRAPTVQELPDINAPDYDLPDPPALDPPDLPSDVSDSQWDLAWLKWVLIVLGIVVVLALIFFGVQALQQRRQGLDAATVPRRSPESAPASEPVLRRFGDQEFNPRIAADDVISAWQKLEEAASRSGTPRLAHHTATEFLGVLGTRVPLHPDAATTLLAAYQRARFDITALTPEQVSVAVTCAGSLVRDLGGHGLAFSPPHGSGTAAL